MTVLPNWPALNAKSVSLGLKMWSFSRLRLLENCPRLFQATYLFHSTSNKKTIRLQHIPASVGIFVHNIFETLLNSPDKNFAEVWMAKIEAAGFTLAEKEAVYKYRYNTQNLVDRLQKAVIKWGLYLQMERRFMHSPLIAYLDFMGLTPSQKTAILLDFKTYSKGKGAKPTKKTKTKAQNLKDQLSLYSLLIFLEYDSVQEIKAGCVHIPDEDVSFNPVVYRKALPALEQRWFKRFSEAINIIEHYQNTDPTDFPATKGEACTWCTLSCAFNKNRRPI